MTLRRHDDVIGINYHYTSVYVRVPTYTRALVISLESILDVKSVTAEASGGSKIVPISRDC